MSDTEIWGLCGHKWIDFEAWVTGDLDEGEECDVEAQFAACDTCWDQLEETITVSALLNGATAGEVVDRDEPEVGRRRRRLDRRRLAGARTSAW